MNASEIMQQAIAVIGMSGRFPGAQNIEAFWQNLRDGIESISVFTDQQLITAGVDPDTLHQPNYVRAGAVLDDIDKFDASFFGYSPREAQITDPQQRLFLECAWEALEDAGYICESYKGAIGVYAGLSNNTYALFNVYPSYDLLQGKGGLPLAIGNQPDFLSTRVSYKLGLRGPSLTVQTACSTSLVAVHLAIQGLLTQECDIALAGGISIRVPQEVGYLYQEGGISSPDGHCRAFDEEALGTVNGNGLGLVVLKRLEDALTDGDAIHAIIRGSAINNDGALKTGYMAPSVQGQAAVIAEALAISGISPETVSYIEAHGTGTALGDPIEVNALTRAFRLTTSKRGFCALGSVKTNIGHLSTAAGIAGLIKTVLSLKHKQIPPSLHFRKPNPQIDFASSPFYVNQELADWPDSQSPRRAGVSSFGFGGTNAHVVLEEAPLHEASGPSRAWQLLMLSTKTTTTLERATTRLAEYLQQHPDVPLADVSYTLQVGRHGFTHRRFLLCSDRQDAANALQVRDPQRVSTAVVPTHTWPIVFMFPGAGGQHVDMGRELYQAETTFREQVDRCAELLLPNLKCDLRSWLYPSKEQVQEAALRLQQPSLALPALFVVEYALAQLWMAWGVRPQAMIGHSLGEYTAACLAGVFSLEDALALVALRGRLFERLPDGAMLSVPLPKEDVSPLLGQDLSLAAVNGPSFCVVSGHSRAVEALHKALATRGIEARLVPVAMAAHSEMVTPILDEFSDFVSSLPLHSPRIPYVSTVSGTWITPVEATAASYWRKHLRQTVLFADGIWTLTHDQQQILLEVGPGRTLCSLVAQQRKDCLALASLPHPQDHQADEVSLLTTLGRLWLAGASVDWSGFYRGERRHRVALPTYPFERQRHWMEAARPSHLVQSSSGGLCKRPAIADWFYVPCWKQAPLPVPAATSGVRDEQGGGWVVFRDRCGVGSQIIKRLEQDGRVVITVAIGERFARIGERIYTVNPQHQQDYQALIQELDTLGWSLWEILHLWGVTAHDSLLTEKERVEVAQELGFYSLLSLTQALEKCRSAGRVIMRVITSNMQCIVNETIVSPGKATVLALCKIIPQEYPHVTCSSIDITLPGAKSWQKKRLLDQLFAEIMAEPSEAPIAYRTNRRWIQTFEAVRAEPTQATPLLRRGGSYLIIGGLGRVGLVLAKYLAQFVQARLTLVGRSAFPARDQWADWLTMHDAQDEVSQKIRAVQEIEALGGHVLVLRADGSNLEQVRGILAQVDERFGALHGVIHSAVSTESAFHTISGISREECESQFRSKIYSLVVLDQVLQGKKLDFCLLQSSISAIIGGLSYAAYAAANSFMDAFAQKQHQTCQVPWISINWDSWHFGEENGEPTGSGAALAKLAIRAHEGGEAFVRALTLGPQVVISTADLQTRLDLWANRKPASMPETGVQEGSILPSPSRRNVQTTYIAPRDEVEQAIAAIWQDILGTEQPGIYDNFSELGGDSLLAIRVISRIRADLEADLPLRRLFETPTIAEIAECLRESRRAGEQPSPFPLTTYPNRNNLPLSFAQQRLWFIDQLMAGSAAYTISNATRLQGPLQLVALEQSLQEIVRRHEVLRTTFALVEGQPVQVIEQEMAIAFSVIDLSTLTEGERQIQTNHLATQETRCSFNLAQGPLMRTKLLRLGKNEHVLLISVHHIIFDGWSMGIFSRELSSLYTAFSQGQPSPLPELPLQYADYALWQRQWLQGEVLEKQLAYWKQQLAGAPPVLTLPADHPHPAIQSFRGAKHSFLLPSSLSEGLKALSRQEGVTLFMTLLAAFQVLLSRYSRQEDIVVGSPIANRNRAEIEPLIGFFVNTLVLRTDLSGNPSFREVLSRAREMCLGAYAHQDLPFEKLVEDLQPQRDLSRNPLFQVMFALQNTPQEALQLPGITLSSLQVENLTTKFDLTVVVWEEGDELGGLLEYNTDFFEKASITRMMRHFQTLLEGIVTDPAECIWELPLLTQTERRQLLEEWNATQSVQSEVICIHQLFEAQVSRTPEAVALVFQDKQLTYHELNERANQLARHLQQQGVGPEVLVGLCVERSLEMVVGLLGILKAGGAYVPLDPTYPKERIEFILTDAQVSVLLTQQRLTAQLPQISAKIICLDVHEAVLAQQQKSNVVSVVTSNNLAYVIYTSGSAGKPKGVQILHRAVVNFLLAMRREPGLSAEDTWLAITTLSFDIAALELFLSLIVGARVLVVSRETAADGAALAELLMRARVTVMQATPVTWRLLLAADWPGKPDLKILCGGEALPLDLAQQLLSRAASLWNMYGPTEATIWSTLCQIKPGEEVISIGRPIANTQVYLLDLQLQPVPVGVPGELYIGGDGLARGYLNRPELTAEHFVCHPFSDEPGARLYKTGDLARYLPDGSIEYLGRLDSQVKIRGYRIELGEIESVLRQHPSIRESVVLIREDTPDDKRLVAYVILRENLKPTASELHHFLLERLPEYMVPSTFVSLETFPLTPSGKVDRRALPTLGAVRLELGATFVAPRTPVEEILADIWTRILRIKHVGIHDNFFELGGHSLLATQVVSRLRTIFQVELPLRKFFETPTIIGLAAAITQEQAKTKEMDITAQLLAKLDELSADEVDVILSNLLDEKELDG